MHLRDNKHRRNVTVYMKSGCITCKRALEYLAAKKVRFQTIEFFKQPLSKDQIRSLLKKAGVSPQQALRKKDKMFRELELGNKRPSDDQLVSLMEKYPGLILRPIVVYGEKAVIATKSDVLDYFFAEKNSSAQA